MSALRVGARRSRALHKCNISDLAWLPRRGFLVGGCVPGMLGAALMAVAAIAAVVGAFAVMAGTTVAAAIAALLVAAAMRPAARAAFMAGFRLLRSGPPAGAAVG